MIKKIIALLSIVVVSVLIGTYLLFFHPPRVQEREELLPFKYDFINKIKTYDSEQLINEYLSPGDVVEIDILSQTIRRKPWEAVNIFLEILERSPDFDTSLIGMHRLGSIIRDLYYLHQIGYYTVDEVPVLIDTLKYKITVMSVSLPSFLLLQEITGINAGVTQEFLETCSESDFLKKIKLYEDWWESYSRSKMNQ